MPVNVFASSFGPEGALAPADTRGRPGGAHPVARSRVDRRRALGAALTLAPELTTALPSGGAGPGSALLHALRQIVVGELEERLAPALSVQPSRWMTPPAASRLTHVPVKSIRAWARAGRIPKRLKNRNADPKQQKYLVNVDDVVATAEQASAAVEAAAGEPDANGVEQRASSKTEDEAEARVLANELDAQARSGTRRAAPGALTVQRFSHLPP
jgi:hypothetical protein